MDRIHLWYHRLSSVSCKGLRIAAMKKRANKYPCTLSRFLLIKRGKTYSLLAFESDSSGMLRSFGLFICRSLYKFGGLNFFPLKSARCFLQSKASKANPGRTSTSARKGVAIHLNCHLSATPKFRRTTGEAELAHEPWSPPQPPREKF